MSLIDVKFIKYNLKTTNQVKYYVVSMMKAAKCEVYLLIKKVAFYSQLRKPTDRQFGRRLLNQSYRCSEGR